MSGGGGTAKVSEARTVDGDADAGLKALAWLEEEEERGRFLLGEDRTGREGEAML